MGENMLNKVLIKVLLRLVVMLLIMVGTAWAFFSMFRGGWDDYAEEDVSYREVSEDDHAEADKPYREVSEDNHAEADKPYRAVSEDDHAEAGTSYRVVFEDDAQLLDEQERQELAAAMQDITAYGNVAFKTINDNDQGTESYARQYYMEHFGTDSGTLFLIDMDNRNIWIHSDGAVYKVITTSYANTITDNVYRYASYGDYYDCAAKAFEQIYALLEGSRIAQPMKYISNGLLAVILALLLNYGLVSFFARLKKPGRKELLRNAGNHFTYTRPEAYFLRESRFYNPVSSGGGGSGGSSGSSSGGSSGGSSSGGGGGHRF